MNEGTQLTRRGRFAHCKTLSDLVVEYTKLKQSGDPDFHGDPVIPFCRKAKNLKQCVERAVAGRSEAGKMFSEGTRIREESKRALTHNILLRLNSLRRARDFEAIFALVDEAKVWGIGACTVFNTSIRVAAYLNLPPKAFLYLHVGPLRGWKRLTGSRESPKRVPLSDVPKALRVLPVHKIEDFLCEFRDAVHPGMMEE